MQIKLNGAVFDVDALTYNSLGSYPVEADATLRETREQIVFRHICRPPGRSRYFSPANPKGQIPLPTLSIFAEKHIKYFSPLVPPVHDRQATRAMQQRYIEKTDATSLHDLNVALNRAFPIPVIQIPVADFAWMDTLVSYDIRMEIDYAIFRLSNMTLAVAFFVALPHRAIFTALIKDFCKAAAFEEMAATGNDPDLERAVVYAGANKRNLEWRRASLRRQLMEIEKYSDNLFPEFKAEKDRLRKEIAALGG